jgi:DNA-binding MarR family transcriptional regulator
MKKPEDRDPGPLDPGLFELENFLPYRLSLLTNTISQGIAGTYRETHDIGIPEWRVLAVLGRFPGLTASEVVERTAMDKVAISRAVKSLEDKGLLQRKADRADGRRQKLFITRGAGETVLGEVVPIARRYEARLLAALDQHELECLLRSMAKLQTAAAAQNKKSRE